MEHEIHETLRKQLQLLSERSKGCVDDHDLAELSQSMVEIANFLANAPLC